MKLLHFVKLAAAAGLCFCGDGVFMMTLVLPTVTWRQHVLSTWFLSHQSNNYNSNYKSTKLVKVAVWWKSSDISVLCSVDYWLEFIYRCCSYTLIFSFWKVSVGLKNPSYNQIQVLFKSNIKLYHRADSIKSENSIYSRFDLIWEF